MHKEPFEERRGVIRAGELYTLKSFKERLEISDATLRSARRAGLQVYYVHRHGYIIGSDWIEYVLKSSRRHNGESNPDAG
jgi:hypothetical protein